MRLSKYFTGALFALSTMVAGIPAATSAVLVSNQGSTFFSMSDFNWFTEFQPMAEIGVGSSSVNIGGFGVYGRAENSGSLKWVVFDGSSLVYQSGTQSVSSGGARWFDSPALSLTLAAGHTYSMGLVATDMFAWGRNEGAISPITANGLTIKAFEGVVQAPNTNGDGVGDGNFAGDPIYASDWAGVDFYQGSVRVFSAGGAVPPIPEPAEWTMLLAGLMVVAFVANRQRRRTM